ncbi:MAG: apolipoprotein N-acyltransferase, partial [Candidatus Ornithospirochaeta sp.]
MKALKRILDFILNIAVLSASAYVASLAFPSKSIESGVPFLAFFYLVPVFWVIWRSHWSEVWLYGALYGFLFYLFYNYWLETFHPLAILIAPTLESIQYALLFLCLTLTKVLFTRHYSIAATILYSSYLYLT